MLSFDSFHQPKHAQHLEEMAFHRSSTQITVSYLSRLFSEHANGDNLAEQSFKLMVSLMSTMRPKDYSPAQDSLAVLETHEAANNSMQ